MRNGPKFTCADCGETYEYEADENWSEEDAYAEAQALWGGTPDTMDMDVLCDTCFNRFMGRTSL